MTDDIAAHNSREYRDAVRRLLTSLTSLTRLRGPGVNPPGCPRRCWEASGLRPPATGHRPAGLRLKHYGSRESRRCATYVSHAVP